MSRTPLSRPAGSARATRVLAALGAVLVTACGGAASTTPGGHVAQAGHGTTPEATAAASTPATTLPAGTPASVGASPTAAPAAPAATSAAPAAPPVHPATPRPPAPGPVGTVGGRLGGCPVFPADNAWNQDVSTLPVSPMSPTYVGSILAGATHLHADFGSDPSYGIPYVVVGAAQPLVPVTFTAYPGESDPGPYPIPPNAPIEAGSDGHVLVADTGNCHLYELYQGSRSGNGWQAANGAVFNLRSDALRPDTWTSADAAGLPILPGLVRYDEVTAGVINHALRFTVSRSQNGFIHPATHQAGSADTTLPPMGLRLRLKASFSLAPYHGEALIILTALKRYGMIVADNGSSWYISGATDSRWDDNDLNQLKTVPGGMFEAVSTGSIRYG